MSSNHFQLIYFISVVLTRTFFSFFLLLILGKYWMFNWRFCLELN
uniref:Uncharacterized protein n=1 Tax=Rhizophora mucronata TaxID=61149 RepID=A0A2P2QCY0_RHIMU